MAVCFDLFDTLIYFDVQRYKNEHVQTAEALEFDPLEFTMAWQQTQRSALAGVFPTIESRCESVLKLLEDEPGSKLESLVEHELASLKSATHVIPGVTELLEALKHQRKRLGVISNASAVGPEILHFTGIDRYLDAQIFSFREKIWKPDPEIFLLACRRLGVHPEETAYVSDGDRNELFGAVDAGLSPVRFDPLGQFDDTLQPHTTRECKSIEELKAHLSQQG